MLVFGALRSERPLARPAPKFPDCARFAAGADALRPVLLPLLVLVSSSCRRQLNGYLDGYLALQGSIPSRTA